jgi:undecaprenyl-diphosphatase
VDLLIYALLGALQGLTEFLPVSSKSHLLLAQHWLGLNPPGVVLEVALHIATLLSVVIVYRADLLRLLRGGDRPYLYKLALGSAVTVALILPYKDRIEALADSAAVIPWTGALLLVTALWLAFADWRIRQAAPRRELSWVGAALIGLAQAVAILPGISRSGSTIGTGLQLRQGRDEAARFSFLLSIPVILGAGVLKTPEALADMQGGSISTLGLGVGFITSLVFGVLAIHLVLWTLRRARLLWFSAYCAVLGVVTLAICMVAR